MSLHWPEELRFLTYVVGQVWPDGDEDRMFAMARAWLDAAEDLEQQVLPVIRTAEGRTLSGYESGAGREQIASALRQLQTGEHSIEQLVEDFRQVGTSTRNAATTMEATKLMTIFAITMLAAQIAGAWLWPPTAPAVEAAAIGATRATLYRVSNRALAALGNLPHVGEYLVKTLRYLPRLTDEPGRIAGLIAKPPTALTARAAPGLFQAFVNAGFRPATARTLAELPADAVQFLISKAANNLIWAGGLDATIQGIQISKGHRDEFDTKQFGMSVVASIGGWYAGALVATNLSKYGGRFLTSMGKDPTAGVWGAGLGIASGTVPTVVATLVGGGIAMGFTGSFDPTMGLIGALSSNSLMGAQRGFIGMRGQEPEVTGPRSGAAQGPAAIGANGHAAQGSPEQVSLRTNTDGPVLYAQRPPKSTSELISEIRARDDQRYRAARAQDRAAVRDAERTPDGGPVDRRAHRDAHTAEQRSQIKELADSRRAVLDAELEVRARERTVAQNGPDANNNVVQARDRLKQAIDADDATRWRIQNRLDALEPRGDLPPATPPLLHSSADGTVAPPAGQRNSAAGNEPNNPARSQADLGIDKPPPPLPNEARGSSVNSPAGQRNSGADSEPDTDKPLPPPKTDTGNSAGSRVRDGETEISPASPTGSGRNSKASHTDAEENSASRNDTERGSGQPPPRSSPEDPTVTTVRNKLTAVDERVATLREANIRVYRAHKRVDEQTIETLLRQRTTHRDALAENRTARETTARALRTLRDDLDNASAEQRPALRQHIDELETTVKRHDRIIEDESASLAVIDQQLTRITADLDVALGAREKAVAEVDRAMTELENAGLAAAAANDAHRARGATTNPFDQLEQLRREARQLRQEADMRVDHYADLDRTSGSAERRTERQIADLEAGLRTERTLLDGGYMSGKPKSRKLPLDHGMPDPFTALRPPPYDFWLPTGPQPTPEPGRSSQFDESQERADPDEPSGPEDSRKP